MNNRLDYIGAFKPGYVPKMEAYRRKFIDLDYELQKLEQDENISSDSKRTLGIARTGIESSCQYVIKTICLLGEDK